MVYLRNPQWYGYHGNVIFASNYSLSKYYLERTVKVLIIRDGFEQGYYNFKIPKKKLLQLSELWAEALIPVCEALMPKWRRLQEKDEEIIRNGGTPKR